MVLTGRMETLSSERGNAAVQKGAEKLFGTLAKPQKRDPNEDADFEIAEYERQKEKEKLSSYQSKTFPNRK